MNVKKYTQLKKKKKKMHELTKKQKLKKKSQLKINVIHLIGNRYTNMYL